MRFLVLVTLFFTTFSVYAQNDWHLESDKKGLSLYTRTVEGQPLKDFRGIIRIKATFSQVVSALSNAEKMPAWFYLMKETEVKMINSQTYLYLVIGGIWPIQDRDAFVRIKVSQNSQTKAITFSTSVVADIYPISPKRIRIPSMNSGFSVTPISENETEVRLDGNANPGGAIPAWAANLVVTRLPEKTLLKLRELLEEKPYDTSILETDPKVINLLKGIKL